MSKISLQILIDKKMKTKGEKAAKANGFDTIQDMLRFFLHSVINGTLITSIKTSSKNQNEDESYISPEAAARYHKDIEEFLVQDAKNPKKGARTVQEFMDMLNEDIKKLP